MIEGMEVLTKPQVNQNGTYKPGKPRGGKYWWMLFFIIKLSDFGEGVKRISFYLLTYQEPSKINVPFWGYNRRSKKIEGSLPVDYSKASKYVDRDAQRLVCEVLFELFDKVSGKVKDFDFEALKKAMLQAVETNPAFAEKTRFRVYSDTEIAEGDIPEFSSAFDLSKYGNGVRKLFFEAGFFKKPKTFIPDRPRFDKNKRGLYISVVSGPDIDQFSSELDKAIEKIKPQVPDFDFDVFRADILQFTESLKEAA
ncbi:MAG: hypothetical protein KDD10_17000 [Phaeodactylibacter sp.]|nr:hypothetical protein [Phaeodactylibacter sp.]